jgi:hypothetical protein
MGCGPGLEDRAQALYGGDKLSLGMAAWGTSFVKNVFTGLPALALVGSMSTAALAHEEAAAPRSS